MFNQESILDWEMKDKYPDSNDWKKWYITNDMFEPKKEIDYDDIMQKIL
jgi:hypothetical protein